MKALVWQMRDDTEYMSFAVIGNLVLTKGPAEVLGADDPQWRTLIYPSVDAANTDSVRLTEVWNLTLPDLVGPTAVEVREVPSRIEFEDAPPKSLTDALDRVLAALDDEELSATRRTK